MDTRQLAAFCAVVERRSFSQAAARLGVTQPAVVGASKRQRSVVFEPLFRDEVLLVCPPGHRFAGQTLSLDELRSEPLIVMQAGAGVRAVIEEELRAAGLRLRDLDVHLELG